MNKIIGFTLVLLSVFACQKADKNPDLLYKSQLDSLNQRLLKGWNTFDNRSILTHVFMPQGYGITLKTVDAATSDTLHFAFTGNGVMGSEHVYPIAHTPNGAYTEALVFWRNMGFRVSTTAYDSVLLMEVTPIDTCQNQGQFLVATEGVFCEVVSKVADSVLTCSAGNSSFTARVLSPQYSVVKNAVSVPLNQSFTIAVNANVTSDEITRQIQAARNKYNTRKSSFGAQADTWNAVQNAVNWTVVYDPQKNRLVTPVSRPWSYGWGNGKPGGYVLFCWDNLFASYMHVIESPDLAMNEALQMCYEIDDLEFVPNFSAQNNLKSRDRSQPPVGSMMVREIYRNHPQKWFLEVTYPSLLIWNKWWEKNRLDSVYLCWGSNPFKPVLDDSREKVANCFEAASNESGLDNTPMYDGVEFDTISHLLPVADVGLMGLYVADCKALAEIAREIGRVEDARQLEAKADKYSAVLQTLWSDDQGIFLNKDLRKKTLSTRISPTNFYPAIGKVANASQVTEMVNKQLLNPAQFWGTYVLPSIARSDTAYTGQDYWRGSIWGPMNFLVYMGLYNYPEADSARKELVKKSEQMLLHNFSKYGYIRENYQAETGEAPSVRSDHFYHWGALLGMMSLIENGHVQPINGAISNK